MSFIPILVALIISTLLLLLSFQLYRAFRQSSPSPQRFPKHFSSFLRFYRERLCRRTQPGPSKSSLLDLIHYLCLHLMVPSWGFGLFLHSDGNFLIVVLSILTSLQLHQRLYSRGRPVESSS